MSNGAGQIVYGSVHLTEEESTLLRNRAAKLNEQFPDAAINMNNFLDMALRVGINIELQAIREEMEAGHADNE